MTTRAAYNAFITFQSAKLHFNNRQFDFTKSRVKIKPESFCSRRDVKQFQRLANLIQKEEILTEFSISSFIRNPKTWVGDVFCEEYLEFHERRMNRVRSLAHTFEQDMESLIAYCDENGIESLKLALTSSEKLPIICRVGMEEETKAIMDIFFSYTKKACPDPTWNEVSLMSHKYGLLLRRKLKEEQKQKEAIERIVATVVATFSKNSKGN